ncbi:AAC(3) family N-acetyltransferase [Pseudoduganella sp. OTU4001]|uniref:AAC(3) family N-acetyltransferase n=1 Tax=Pseudoduganella sp. OTU4001 TaxID=3043854 RepID=UPI00313DD537
MLKPAKRMVKQLLERLRRYSNAKALKQTRRHISREELVAGLASLGIDKGDAVFIHSSLKSLGYVEGGAATVVQALQEAVGPQGTLVLPTYYMPGGSIRATCEMADYVFDVRKHGTNMGRLPEAFLASPGIQRSVHPTHSVSAWGRHASYLTEAHHHAPSVFGEGSPWQRFVGLEHAKVLGLGISMGPVTFYHVLEDAMGDAFPVKVWGEQTFRMPVIDQHGQRSEVPVRPFDPELAKQRIDHPSREDLRNFFMDEFKRAGLLHRGQVGEAPSWWIPARGFFDHLQHMAAGNLTIYSAPEQLTANSGRSPT